MRTFIGQVPLSVVAVAVSIAIAIWASPRIGRRLGTGRLVSGLLLLGFGLVIAATLVPTAAALEGGSSDGMCDTSRVGLATFRELTSVTGASLNVLLFVPLGLAVGLLPRTRPGVVVALAAVSLTFMVEAIQLLAPVLGRGCQTADLVDNTLGLMIGLAVALLVRRLLPVKRRTRS